jgi:ATP-dependent helicase/nuclease subunit A
VPQGALVVNGAGQRFTLDDVAIDADTFRRAAIDPSRSIVVDACAGSGKTTLLVARIVRALLEGAEPDQVLAVTFTRLAAHEMRERLATTLREMSLDDDATLRTKLSGWYGLGEARADALAARARGLYEMVLCHPRGPEITTFHRWFRTLALIGPLSDESGEGSELTEEGAVLLQQAWHGWLDMLHAEGGQARRDDFEALVREIGLSATRGILASFVDQRAEWSVGAGVDLDTPIEALEAAAERSARAYAALWREAARAFVAEGGGTPDAVEDVDAFARAVAADGPLRAWMAALAPVFGRGGKKGVEAADAFVALSAPTTDDPVAAGAWVDALAALVLSKEGEPRQPPLIPTQKKQLDLAGEGEAVSARWGALCARVVRACALRAEWRGVGLNAAALRCAVGLLDTFRNAKRAQGVIDFADLESVAWRMLRDPATAAYVQCRMDRRYRHLLFDEFQDTSSLQWRVIADWLQSYAGAGERPSVFVVGDPKQSIYRFRRAEARVFDAAKDLLREAFGARVAGTDTTRRNAPAIVDALNASLPRSMAHYRPQATAVDACRGLFWRLPLVDADAPGDAAAGQAAGADAPSFDWLTSDREDEASTRHLEGLRIADAILAARAALAAQGRTVAWREIYVLARSRTHFEAYERALRERGLPVRSDRAGGLLRSLEGGDLRALLAFVRHPSDDLALAQVLASPLIGLDAASLGWIASHAPTEAAPVGSRDDAPPDAAVAPDPANGAEDASDSAVAADTTMAPEDAPDASRLDVTASDACAPQAPVPAASPSRHWWPRLRALAAAPPPGDPPPFDLPAVVARLEGWVEQSARWPVHDFLDAALAQVDAFARYPAAVEPAQREVAHANLCAMLGLALDVDAGRFPSLARFLRRLRGFDTLDERESPDEGRGEAVDAIRLMTIHASKGLEADLVVLADANASGRDDGRRLHVDWPPDAPRPLHLSFALGGALGGVSREKSFEREDELREREDRNLLYVALTRARFGVVVTGARGRGANASGWWSMLDGCEPPPDAHAQPDAPARDADAPFALCLLELPRLGVGAQRDPGGAHGERDADGSPAGLLATELGHALHRALELLPAGADEATVLAALHAFALDDAQRRAAFAKARAVLGLASLSPAFDASAHAASEFEIVDADGEVRRIDRIARVGDEAWIVDYKWSVDASRRAAYREQLAVYRALYVQLEPPPLGAARRVRTVLVDASAGRVEFDVDLGAVSERPSAAD